MPAILRQKNSHNSDHKGSPSPHKKSKRWRSKFKKERMNTVRFQTEQKVKQFSSPQSLAKFAKENNWEFDIFNLTKDQLGSTFKPTISALIDFNVLQEQSKLQNKIDYYITPYNPKINVNESMQFGDKAKQWGNLKELAKKDWKLISDFICKTNKKEFRQTLGLANRRLYSKITDLAVSVLSDRKLKNKFRNYYHSWNFSGRRNLNTTKSLKKQQTMIYKQEFHTSMKKWYEGKNIFLEQSDKSIGEVRNLGEYRNKSKSSPIKEYSSIRIPKLVLDDNEDEPKNEEPSIISPLMKILRQMNAAATSSHSKPRDMFNTNKYEVKLKDIKFKNFKNSIIKENENLLNRFKGLIDTNQSPVRTTDDFALKIYKMKSANDECNIGLKHRRNMSSEKISKYKPMFKSPEPREDDNLCLPPIINTEMRQIKRWTVFEKTHNSKLRSHWSSSGVTTKPSSQNVESVIYERKEIDKEEKICQIWLELKNKKVRSWLHEPISHSLKNIPDMKQPILTVSQLEDYSKENEWMELSSDTSSVTQSCLSGITNLKPQKRKCKGMYDILDNMLALTTVDTKDTSNVNNSNVQPEYEKFLKTESIEQISKPKMNGHHRRYKSTNQSKERRLKPLSDLKHVYKLEKLKPPVEIFKLSKKYNRAIGNTEAKLMKFL